MNLNYSNKKLKTKYNIKYKILLYFTMEKFTVIIFKGNVAPSTISHFDSYLKAYAFAYKYANTYFKNIFLTSYSDTYKNLCSTSLPIISIPYPNQNVRFEIYIYRGHNLLNDNNYYWNLIHPAEAITLSPVGHITDTLLDYTHKPILLLPIYISNKLK